MGIYIGQNKIGMVGSSSTSQVENGTLGKPTIDEFGVITTKVEKSGYLNAGASTSLELNTQAGKTIKPSTSEQVAVPAKVYTTGVVEVEAVPSETLEISQNGTYTPSEGKWFSSVTVAVPVEEFNLQEKTVTPSEDEQVISPETGYNGLSRVTVNAIPSDYIKPSGTINIITNDTYDVTNYATAIVNVSSSLPATITAGDTPILSSSELVYTCNSTTMTNTGIFITVPKAGTYRFKFSCGRTNTSGTWTTQLYKNGSAISGATASWSSYQGTYNGTVNCNANDVITIYAKTPNTYSRSIIGQLVACIDWNINLS